jgi:predicted transcriptional regulator of viral defense system
MEASRTPRPRVEEAYVRLSRSSRLAGRPGVAVLEADIGVLDEFTGSRTESRRLVGRLESDGRLQRVRRGAYVLVDSSGVVRVNLLDLIAALTPNPYLVTAGRALQFHELSDQHYRRVHVLAPSQQRTWSWRGDEVRYAQTEKSLRKATRTRSTRARIALPERAIVDSITHPGWGVTLAQVVEAVDLMLGRDARFPDLLAAEVVGRDSHAAARRLGFLVARLAGEESARVFLPLLGESKAATPLLAGTGAVGPIDSVWRIRANVDVDRLLQHRRVM